MDFKVLTWQYKAYNVKISLLNAKVSIKLRAFSTFCHLYSAILINSDDVTHIVSAEDIKGTFNVVTSLSTHDFSVYFKNRITYTLTFIIAPSKQSSNY